MMEVVSSSYFGDGKDIGYIGVKFWRRWKGAWFWSFLKFIAFSFWESSWHGSTSKDKGEWRVHDLVLGLVLGSLGLVAWKRFATKWRLAWVSFRGSPWE